MKNSAATLDSQQRDLQQLELFGRRRLVADSPLAKAGSPLKAGSSPVAGRLLAQSVRLDRQVSGSVYTFRRESNDHETTRTQRPIQETALRPAPALRPSTRKPTKSQHESHGFEVLNLGVRSFELMGATTLRGQAPSDSAPAQLADEAASFRGQDHQTGLPRRAPKHVTTKHATPKRATPKRARRLMKVARGKLAQVKVAQVKPAKASAPTKRAPRSESTSVAMAGHAGPLSSAALSYVFVAVTLACTFLV